MSKSDINHFLHRAEVEFERIPQTDRREVLAAHYRLAEAGVLTGTYLDNSPFLSREERSALESAATPLRSLEAGKNLIREGDLGSPLQVLIDGWAYRYKTTRDGRRQIVALLMPGSVVNLDASMFTHLDYGVRSLTAAKILPIPQARVLALAELHNGIARTLAWLAMSENAILSQWALCLGRQSAKQRLAHLLCEVSGRLGNKGEPNRHFELPISQEQIADMIGLTAVHVNRMFQQLRLGGVIETRGRSIAITDIDALRKIAEFDEAYLHRGVSVELRDGRHNSQPAASSARPMP